MFFYFSSLPLELQDAIVSWGGPDEYRSFLTVNKTCAALVQRYVDQMKKHPLKYAFQHEHPALLQYCIREQLLPLPTNSVQEHLPLCTRCLVHYQGGRAGVSETFLSQVVPFETSDPLSEGIPMEEDIRAWTCYVAGWMAQGKEDHARTLLLRKERDVFEHSDSPLILRLFFAAIQWNLWNMIETLQSWLKEPLEWGVLLESFLMQGQWDLGTSLWDHHRDDLWEEFRNQGFSTSLVWYHWMNRAFCYGCFPLAQRCQEGISPSVWNKHVRALQFLLGFHRIYGSHELHEMTFECLEKRQKILLSQIKEL